MKSIKRWFKRIKISGIYTLEKGIVVLIPTIAIAWGDGVTIGILWLAWSAAIDFELKPETSEI